MALFKIFNNLFNILFHKTACKNKATPYQFTLNQHKRQNYSSLIDYEELCKKYFKLKA